MSNKFLEKIGIYIYTNCFFGRSQFVPSTSELNSSVDVSSFSFCEAGDYVIVEKFKFVLLSF